MLPTGEKQREGNTLVLGNVTRLDAGSYICSAANGVDRAVEAKVELTVICKYYYVLPPTILPFKDTTRSPAKISDYTDEKSEKCNFAGKKESPIKWMNFMMVFHLGLIFTSPRRRHLLFVCIPLLL